MAVTPNYVVGRGKLYFDQFLAGTKTPSGSERYLGNSPELALSQSEEKLDHFNSDGGIRVKDASISLQTDMSGSFTLDDISSENLALWFRGEYQVNALAAVTNATTTVDAVKKGQYIQLGRTDSNHVGNRNVSGVAMTNVTQANAVVTMSGNYEIDAVTGRIYVLEDAPDIDEDDELEIEFDAAVGTEDIVIGSGETIEGRLVFIADNAAGDNRDYIWPYVQISPDGDFSLKGDDWLTQSFSMEILKLNDSTERQYIVKR